MFVLFILFAKFRGKKQNQPPTRPRMEMWRPPSRNSAPTGGLLAKKAGCVQKRCGLSKQIQVVNTYSLQMPAAFVTMMFHWILTKKKKLCFRDDLDGVGRLRADCLVISGSTLAVCAGGLGKILDFTLGNYDECLLGLVVIAKWWHGSDMIFSNQFPESNSKLAANCWLTARAPFSSTEAPEPPSFVMSS